MNPDLDHIEPQGDLIFLFIERLHFQFHSVVTTTLFHQNATLGDVPQHYKHFFKVLEIFFIFYQVFFYMNYIEY